MGTKSLISLLLATLLVLSPLTQTAYAIEPDVEPTPATTDVAAETEPAPEIDAALAAEATFIQPLDSALAQTVTPFAQTDYSGNISQYTDTSSGAARTRRWAPSDFPGNNNLGRDPENGGYYQLARDRAQVYSWVTMPITPTAEADWSIDGYFKPDRIPSNGASNGGDFLGINVYPKDGDTAANGAVSGGGGSLGLMNTPNSYGLNLDFIQNTNYGDPSPGPFGAFRWTDSSSGNLAWMGNRSNLYTRSGNITGSADMRNWKLPIKYTLTYHYNGGNPYFTGGLDDKNGNSWTFDTRSTGGDSLPITVPTSRYWNVVLISANGSNYQNTIGSLDNFSGQIAATTNRVRYYLDGTTTEIAPSTTILGGVGETITIRGADNNDSSSSTFSFNGNVPVGVQSQYANGYHAKRIIDGNDQTTAKFTFVKNDAGPYEVYTRFSIFYAPDFQFSRLITDSSDPNGGREIDNISGVTNGTMSGWKTSDTDLARNGRVYTVKAPNGQTYTTLAAARAAVTNFDATNNGAAQSDSTPQDFIVTYSNVLQQAIVRGVTNGTTSTIATYDNTTNATTGTPNRPLEEGTTGTLKTAVQDSSLAKPGYTYTVTYINEAGTEVGTYATMQAAWAANNVWGTSNNPAGATTDAAPQIYRVNYTGVTQVANITQTSADGRGPTGNKERATGASGTRISFTNADSNLAVAGYSYTVNYYRGDGTLVANYNSLQSALTANPLYDANAITPPATEDPQPQRFEVVYTPTNQNVTYYYVDNNNNTIHELARNQQPTNADIDTSNPLAIQGYVFDHIDTARSDPDMRVNADGSSVVYRVYRIDPAIITAGNKAITDANNSEVKNDAAVIQKRNDLQNLLNSTTATAQQIQDATKALNDQVATSTTQHHNVEDAAKKAIADSNTSSAKNEPSVITARNDLQRVMDDPNHSTEQIQAATKTLNDTVASEQTAHDNAVKDANTAKSTTNTAPVTNEPGVQTAKKNLEDVLNNPNSTTQQIKDATTALNNAVATAKTERNQANADGDTAKNNATSSPASNDQRVQDALNNLKQLQDAAAADSPTAITERIKEATTALNNAVTQATSGQTTARNDANTAMQAENTRPVTNEPGVVDAKNKLQTVLSDPKSTEAQIKEATDALKTAVTSATKTRNDAKESAQASIAKAEAGPDGQTTAVQNAINDLRNTIAQADADSPSALTAQIIDKTHALDTASQTSDAANAQARRDANTAISNTSPVTNEPDVAARETELKNLLARQNPQASTDELTTATTALNNAVTAAKSARTTANDQANQAITDARNNTLANGDPAVKAAIEKLQNTMTQAANDSPNALTSNINADKDALNQAVANAQSQRTAANSRADQAIANSAPVTNEPNIKTLGDQLTAAKNDPNTTAAQLDALTDGYNTAVANAKTERDNAKTDANTAISNTSTVGTEPTVQQAVANLQDTITKADANDATALTQQIKEATDRLKTVTEQEQTRRNDARSNAQTAITNADNSKVKNETPVVNAENELKQLLESNTATTDQIIAATTKLNDAVKAANDARDAAVTNANTASTNARNSSPNVFNEESVYTAENNLQNVLKNPESTTQQIIDATNALNKAVDDAKTARGTAQDNATKALTDANNSAVKNQPTVARDIAELDRIKNDPNSTTKQITDATNALNTAVSNATRDRGQANDDANKAKDPANTSPVSNEPTVVAARNNLNSVQSNPNSSTQQIADATTAMNTAVEQAKTARNTAVDEGTSLANSTAATSVGKEPSVVAAINNLNNKIAESKTDSPSALTSDIRTAMQQLKDAADAAQKVRDDAKKAIADADASPVGNEQTVKDAKQNLQNVLNNPESTSAQITQATNALKDAQQQAQQQRDIARDNANQQIADSNRPPNNTAQSVIDARNDLQKVLDNPASTTQQIRDATTALDNAMDAARTSRDNAVDAAIAASTSENSSPVSNEPEVIAAQQKLDNTVSNRETREADITRETTSYQQVVAVARQNRQSATSDGYNAIQDANTNGTIQNPEVKAAEDRFYEVVNTAQSNSPSALTADIEAAAAAIRAASKAAQDARSAAQTAITEAQASPVAGDSSVQQAINNLQNILNDPASSTAAIEQATAALRNAVDAALNAPPAGGGDGGDTGTPVTAGATGSGSTVPGTGDPLFSSTFVWGGAALLLLGAVLIVVALKKRKKMRRGLHAKTVDE